MDDDADGDALLDLLEGTADPDGDGIPASLDEDSDGDGIANSVEGGGDADGDGLYDAIDEDADGDGIDDAVGTGADTDEDGTPTTWMKTPMTMALPTSRTGRSASDEPDRDVDATVEDNTKRRLPRTRPPDDGTEDSIEAKTLRTGR